MTDPRLPTTPNSDQQTTKRVDELEPGDWLSTAFTQTDTGDPAEVLSVHPFDGRSLVVYTTAEGLPVSKRWDNGIAAVIASADEIARSREQRAQWTIAEQLRSLSELVLNLNVPMNIEYGQVRIVNQLADLAEVAALGERLGIAVAIDSVGRNSVWWPRGREFGPGVLVEWYRYDPDFKKPDAETADADHGRTTAVADAKPDTLGVALGRASVPDMQNRPQCLPGCYDPTLTEDHVPGCPVASISTS